VFHRQGLRVAVTVVVFAGTAMFAGTLGASRAAYGVTITLPDLKINVPTDQISIGVNSSTGHRQLQFTHQTWDAGTGPFAILPTVNATTGVSSFVQEIYRSTSPGSWVIDHSRRIAVAGSFQAPSDYNFPLTRFTLNKYVSATIGPVVAVSPKVDYCITGDTYIGGVPNTPNSTSPPQDDCTNPNALLGFSVGWGDQYDQTDDGQPIDLTGVADGTYVLHAVVDPQHVFQESDSSNDVTNTVLSVHGNNVQVLSQSSPSTPIPSVALTSPANGAQLAGTVTLTSSTHAVAPATVVSVRYLLDGTALGAPVTKAPYTLKWGTLLTTGTHTLSAQVTDSWGNVATSQVRTITIAHSKSGAIGLDSSARKTGHGTISSPQFSTHVAGDTLVAFVNCDGPLSGSQSVKITGAALTWRLVKRSNAQAGDAEIWVASSARILHDVRVSAVEHFSGFAQQLQILALSGTAGVGAYNAASGSSGAPKVVVRSAAAGSVLLGVGADWDHALSRSVDAGQSIVSQWVDENDGDTFWVQGVSSTTSERNQLITIDDSEPTTDRWDMAGVEIKASSRTPLLTSVTTPAAHEVLSNSVPVHVVASDNVALRSVTYAVGGRVLATRHGLQASREFLWNTSSLPNGPRTLTVRTTDVLGRSSISSVPILIANPAPDMTCFVLDARMSASGGAQLSSPLIRLAGSNERLLAFVRTGALSQSLTLHSSKLSWRLLRRESSRSGSLALWTTTSGTHQHTIRVTSNVSGTRQTLIVLGLEGTKGVGAVVASRTSGNPVKLSTRSSNSLIFSASVQSNDPSHSYFGWTRITLSRHDAELPLTLSYTNQPSVRRGQPSTLPYVATRSTSQAVVAVELPGSGD
jgi:hypothetical protein